VLLRHPCAAIAPECRKACPDIRSNDELRMGRSQAFMGLGLPDLDVGAPEGTDQIARFLQLISKYRTTEIGKVRPAAASKGCPVWRSGGSDQGIAVLKRSHETAGIAG